MEIHENLDQRLTGEAWADILIKNFFEKFEKLGIGDSMTLAQSFVTHVYTAANGDLEKISIAFEYYGKFVDMGVGKGTKIGDVKENSISRALMGRQVGNARRRKPWLSKTFFSDFITLAQILAKKYAITAQMQISEALPDKVTLTF